MPVAFTKLRIAGFKSFAEPVSLEIHPGLTGIIGPNGCGKSNVVEALRWAMGENSARSMRGSEMDDVIFAGTAHRSSRNLAEVTIGLELSEGLAPSPWQQATELQISRQIERGSGSTYRVNGKEARARDVQTLLADLASGARSAAMVSQGKIGQLVNARPDERRAILEEAAGITGLHARRHEAELKLGAAETNLTRAEDLRGQLLAQLESLKRQARQTARYRNISGLVRAAEAEYLAFLNARASVAGDAARVRMDAAEQAVQKAEIDSTETQTAHERAEAALAEPRGREATARSLLERTKIEAEGLEAEEERVTKALQQAQARHEQTSFDVSEAANAAKDAEEAVFQLTEESAQIETDLATLPERLLEAENALDAAIAETKAHLAEADQAATEAARAVAEAARIAQALTEAEARYKASINRLEVLQLDFEIAREEIVSPEKIADIASATAEAEAALEAAHAVLAEAEPAHRAARQIYATLRAELTNAEAERQRAEAVHLQASRVVESLQEDCRRLMAERDALQNGQVSDEALNEAAQKLESAEAERLNAMASLEQAEAARAAAVAAVAEAQRQRDEVASNRRQAEASLRTADESSTRIKAQYAALRAEHDQVAKQRADHPDDGEIAEKSRIAAEEVESSSAQLRDAEQKRAEATRAHQDAVQAGVAADAAWERTTTESDAVAMQLARLQEQIASFQTSMDEAKRALSVRDTLHAAQSELTDREASLAEAIDIRTNAETALETARSDAETARANSTRLDADHAKLEAELSGLAASQAGDDAPGPRVLDGVAIPTGLEAALDAGLAEALDAGIDGAGHRYWMALDAPDAPSLPSTAEKLSSLIAAPKALQLALNAIGVLPDGVDGASLQPSLKPGQILVNRAGAAWRWDGYVRSADAPAPGVAKLRARARLIALRQALEECAERQIAYRASVTQADLLYAEATRAVQSATGTQQARENSVRAARDDVARLGHEAAQAEQKAAMLEEQQSRLWAEKAELDRQAEALAVKQAGLPDRAEQKQARGRAEADLQAITAQEQALRVDRQRAEQAWHEAQAQEMSHRSAVAEAEARLAALQPQLARLQDDQARAEKQHEDAKAQLAGLQDGDRLEAAYQSARSAASQAEQAEAACRAARIAAETALAEQKAVGAALRSRYEDTRTKLESLNARLPQLEEQRGTKQAELDACNATLASLPVIETLRDGVARAAQAERDAATQEETARAVRSETEAKLAAHKTTHAALLSASQAAETTLAALTPQIASLTEERDAAKRLLDESIAQGEVAPDPAIFQAAMVEKRDMLELAREAEAEIKQTLTSLRQDEGRLTSRKSVLETESAAWGQRYAAAQDRLQALQARSNDARSELEALTPLPAQAAERRAQADDLKLAAEEAHQTAERDWNDAERQLRSCAEARRSADIAFASAREAFVRAEGALEQASGALEAVAARILERLGENAELPTLAVTDLNDITEDRARKKMERLSRERDEMGPVNLRADIEVEELETRVAGIDRDRDELTTAIAKLRGSIGHLNREGRERLSTVFATVDGHFQTLFSRMFGGGKAHLAMVGSDDPLLAGLEIFMQPPGKKLATLSLLSGGEQALTALSLIFAVFRCNPAPICVLDEVDAPLDDANVDRFCMLLQDMSGETGTRFLVVTHHQQTMARMDRLYGVTMQERGISRVLSVDLAKAVAMIEPVAA